MLSNLPPGVTDSMIEATNASDADISIAQDSLLHKANGLWLSDLLMKPPPPWLFDRFLRDRSITMVNAEPFSGKTLFLLAMAIAMDANLPLFGKFAPLYPRSVLFIGGGDAPDWDYGAQAKKLMLGYGLDERHRSMSSVAILPYEGHRLTDQSFLDWLSEWHELNPFDVLIIDTLLSVHRADENDARSMGAVFSVIKGIRDRFKAAVIFGQHDAKQQEGKSAMYRPRGSSVIAGSVDFILSLQRRKNRVKLTATKGRGAVMEHPTEYFDISDIETPEGPGIELRIPQDARETLVLEALRVRTCTRGDLCALLKVAEPDIKDVTCYRAVDNTLSLLSSRKLIKNVKRGLWEAV